MSGWKAKRFWKTVAVVEAEGGYGVTLDARPVRTPAKCALVLPTRAMAEAIATEWEAVEKEVDPRRMPVTRAANAAIDKVAPQFDEVATLIAAYGGTDLLCYRAVAPEALAEAQAAAWDPLLDWAAREYGARLNVTRGVVPVAQPAESLVRLTAAVRALSPFELTALHDLVSLSGSLVLGLAATRPEFDSETLWRHSRFDEDWQTEQWGEDEEAVAAARMKRDDFLFARHFWNISEDRR
ncbi:ATPase [Defluviimonas sp. WL0024]|uniref:ATPase n=1 Tax=Albidovulum salinarum TaxID=2984153 RepID=A0ABT2X385_9RHOB|nr:ATP12 family protein [Defluviimonas sp. WL0024]MCU9848406.1 ATPase [Defluviimonas sp. WL0024]